MIVPTVNDTGFIRKAIQVHTPKSVHPITKDPECFTIEIQWPCKIITIRFELGGKS